MLKHKVPIEMTYSVFLWGEKNFYLNQIGSNTLYLEGDNIELDGILYVIRKVELVGLYRLYLYVSEIANEKSYKYCIYNPEGTFLFEYSVSERFEVSDTFTHSNQEYEVKVLTTCVEDGDVYYSATVVPKNITPKYPGKLYIKTEDNSVITTQVREVIFDTSPSINAIYHIPDIPPSIFFVSQVEMQGSFTEENFDIYLEPVSLQQFSYT